MFLNVDGQDANDFNLKKLGECFQSSQRFFGNTEKLSLRFFLSRSGFFSLSWC